MTTPIKANCDVCPMRSQTPVVARKGGTDAKLIVVLEQPGRIEEEKGAYLVGPIGKLVEERILAECGIPRHELYVLAAVCCRAPTKPKPEDWRQAIECCRPHLAHQLARCKSKSVLVCGTRALQSLTGHARGVGEFTGSPIPGKKFETFEGRGKKRHTTSSLDFSKYTLLPTYHPPKLFGDIAYLPVMRIHFMRAWEMAHGRLEPWVWPTLHVERGEGMISALEDILGSTNPCSVDIETAGMNPFENKITCIGFFNGGQAVSVPWHSYDAGPWGRVLGCERLLYAEGALVRRILKSEKIPKIFQNGQYDLCGLRTWGLEVNGPIIDTLAASAVCRPHLPHDLAFQCSVEFHAPRWKDEFHAGGKDVKGSEKWVKRDPIKLRTYNACDNVMQYKLWMDRLRLRLAEVKNGDELFEEYTKLNRIAYEMCWRGVPVNAAKRVAHIKALIERKTWALKSLRAAASLVDVTDLNPNSQAQLRNLFFGVLKCTPTHWSEDTGVPSLDEVALTTYVVDPSPIVSTLARTLLQYRKWNTLDRTQASGLPVHKDGKVHSFWRPSGAVTGRWTSSRPNAQNIAPALRNMYTAHDGQWVVKADMSQLELRIIALLSGDRAYMKTYSEGLDVHAWTVREVFGIKDRPATKEERTLAKNFNYNLWYGGEAQGIYEKLSVDNPDVTLRMVKELMARMKKAHPDIEDWHDDLLRAARESGHVEAPFSGRRRYFYGKIISTEIFNYPVQSTAADIVNAATQRVYNALHWPVEGILFQCHDELVLDGPDPVRLAEILHTEMSVKLEYKGRTMDFPCEMAIGRSWGETEPMTLGEVRAKFRRGA